MAEKEKLIVIILLMALVTYIPRVLPLRINQKYFPAWLQASLEFLPVAIVASITMPGILIESYSSLFLNAEFSATIFAVIIAYFSRNLIITVLSSLVFLFIIQEYLLINSL